MYHVITETYRLQVLRSRVKSRKDNSDFPVAPTILDNIIIGGER